MMWLLFGIGWMALGGYSIGGCKGMVISLGVVAGIIALICMI